MNAKTVNKILSDTSYIRIGGTAEELRCAEYLRHVCAEMGMDTVIEPFDIAMYKEECACLTVGGREIECKGWFGSASGTVTGELYYLEGTDNISLKGCRDKIVLTDKAMGHKLYDMMEENGARGFITYNGNINFSDRDVDRKEIRFFAENGVCMPGVNIHVSDAVDIVKRLPSSAQITLRQASYVGQSHNVILDLDGESEETVIISAHYDSTSLSEGAYDNMSGCIGLLYLAEYFAATSHRRRIRLLWCGSEERGLIGSRAYCGAHRDELGDTVLNINLDMLGSVMGGFVAFSCADEQMAELLEGFISKHGFSATVRHDIRSSDSNSFVLYGVPAVSFARYAPSGTAQIHSRYDTAEVVSAEWLLDDMRFIASFTEYAANAEDIPRNISEKIRSDVEAYFKRKL